MPINPYYPGEVAEAALRRAREEQQQERKNVRRTNQQQQQSLGDDVLQSCLLWRTFGFALVSPVVENLDLYSWFRIEEFLEEFGDSIDDIDDPEECLNYFEHNEARMVDIDLLWGPTTKTILELRLMWMAGGRCMEGFYGFLGKAFARNDPDKRVLFHISSEMNGEILVEPVQDDEVFEIFEDRTNGPFADLFRYLRSDVRQNYGNFNEAAFGRIENQPSFLLALAFFAAREYSAEAQTIRNGLSRTETSLRLLGKYDDASVNRTNPAARILCGREDGGLRNLIASYAAEGYLSVGERDTTLWWYTKHLEWLVQSLWCEENGDAQGAQQALSAFVREGKANEHKIIFGFDNIELMMRNSSILKFRNVSGRVARPLAMGLEKDRTIFPELTIASESSSSSLKRKSYSE